MAAQLEDQPGGWGGQSGVSEEEDGREKGRGNGHRAGGALWATVTRVLFTIFPYLQRLRPKRDGACLLGSLWHPQLLE